MMIFACHNLNKMANWRWKYTEKNSLYSNVLLKILKLWKNIQKKEVRHWLNVPLCQQSETTLSVVFTYLLTSSFLLLIPTMLPKIVDESNIK